ncbi:MAG: T9SS type A sorting domain-containing protein [Candidatus Eisenbacteria bacterium]
MKRVLLIGLVCCMFPVAAYATPYVTPEELMSMESHEDVFTLRAGVPGPRPFDYEYDPLARLLLGADFIVTMQVSDTLLMTYGGIREGEHMLEVIQTDNTSESIWIWSRCYSRSGLDAYHDNIDAAWEYCMNNPAYGEEGGDDRVTGYYRVYNCGWALRAEMEYRRVYGDATYSAYADSCASYLCHHPMYLFFPVGAPKRLNGMIMGWAVGNLYDYGVDVGSTTYMTKAVDYADSVKAWAETNPNKFHWQEWAMEGGAVMWGVVNSYFKDDPTGVETWVDTYAPYLDTEVDSSQYQNAWRGWAALGQITAAEVLGSGVYYDYFKHLADTLVLNDGDLDGGIPVTDPEPDDQDQSWVTNYLGFMCMDKLLENAGIASRQTRDEAALDVSAGPMPSGELPSLMFRLAEPSRVSITVYDVTGRSISSRDAGILSQGFHSIALNEGLAGGEVSPGIYFYTLRYGTGLASGKVVVLK